MFSLQNLSMRKIDDDITIPEKYNCKRCCKTINEDEAVKNGHLECLKYALANNSNEDNEIFIINEKCYINLAARYVRLNCLEYFLKQNYDCDEVCTTSAEYG